MLHFIMGKRQDGSSEKEEGGSGCNSQNRRKPIFLMRILMQGRSNFFDLIGGDTVQLLKTKEQLERLGSKVDICLELNPDLSGYDIVHLSNITRIQETYLQMQNAKRQNKKVALSTIYWPMEDFEKKGQVGVRKIINEHLGIDNIERIKAIARTIKDSKSRNKATMQLITKGYTKMQQYVVNNADIFLPNAELEMREVEKTFGIQNEEYRVIPNAVDLSLVDEAEKETVPDEYLQYKDAVICVGRIETRKNQLGLVRALEGTKYKVLIVGGVSENQKAYFNEVKSVIDRNENFTYLPFIDNGEIYKLYKICKVSALPSWLDTPGLVSLEAASMGCNLAVSIKGTTTEYFREYASYCEPDDLDSIKTAVDEAFNKPKQSKLVKLIREKYNWEEAGKRTLDAYRSILN